MEQVVNKGLGRLISLDKRDKNYPLKALLPRKAFNLTKRFWRSSTYWGDQGETSQCVAYSWIHYIHHGPLTMPGKYPIVPPVEVYMQAQKIDEWPGENYDGTSVRAGAEVLKSLGYIAEYRWGYTLEELIQAVLHIGPVVVGTDWLTGMFEPDANGFIRANGWPAGGHAYLIDGADTKNKYFRIKNSWGRNWAAKGNAFITFADMEYLINKPFAEICLAIETRKKI